MRSRSTAPGPLIVARDGWAIDLDEEVRDGDRILVSPVFSGG